MKTETLKRFTQNNADLQAELENHAQIATFESGTELLRIGQYVKVIPIVLEGAIKVFTQNEDKDLLLYYIEPNQSCIMSYTAGLHNDPSKVYAITETETTAILIPSDVMVKLTRKYPELNSVFIQQYNNRYADLIETINQIIFSKLDERVLEYLKKKSEVLETKELHISHREIAHDLGTAREVISRIVKKLEQDGRLEQHNHTIKLSAL